MKFGVNLLLYNGLIGEAEIELFPLIKDIGFDGVEVPVFDPDKMNLIRIREAAKENGLSVSVSGALANGTRLYGDDKLLIKKAQHYLYTIIEAAVALGSPLICGPLYKCVGDMDLSIPLEEQRDQVAKNLRPIAKKAESVGVVLAYEPLNRFETNLINTVEQGIDFCKAQQSPSAQLLLDTFHMHIEEKDTAEALQRAFDAHCFGHFHASENDRGTAGSGQVHWDRVMETLKANGYDDRVVLESFSMKVEEIRKAVSCWRPFYDDPERFMRDGLAFVKEKWQV
ncbi:MAG: sugar phosphate isomerase/epimerase [Candidatus Latescibacteria bacterium]|mgnify:FL=1|jgi:D-psicose/D-tagatose/L-ribulose 3-epimerase|nr:sugar phosphate isomerase/epimerase [Candidatus Latescibacterota bacterium]